MPAYLPFLISTNSFGIIALLIWLASSVIFMIPALSTRGGTQVAWFSVGGLALFIEAAVLITLLVLVNNGTIWTKSLEF